MRKNQVFWSFLMNSQEVKQPKSINNKFFPIQGGPEVVVKMLFGKTKW